ncbi:MAG: hypothetical protein HQL77_18190 [Magnetococcales bacterium]|nr:hypothetical protein [Magnetococcales bacterium]
MMQYIKNYLYNLLHGILEEWVYIEIFIFVIIILIIVLYWLAWFINKYIIKNSRIIHDIINKINIYSKSYDKDFDITWHVEQYINKIASKIARDDLNGEDSEKINKIKSELIELYKHINNLKVDYCIIDSILLTIERIADSLSSEPTKNEIIDAIYSIRIIFAKSGCDNQDRVKALLDSNTYGEFTRDAHTFANNDHAKLSSDVNFRLNLRHAVLVQTMKQIESIWNSFQSSGQTKTPPVTAPSSKLISIINKCGSCGSILGGETNNSDKATNPETDVRYAYHLAVTDLFVEKAIAYLEKHANAYRKLGISLYLFALIIVLGGTGISIYSFIDSSYLKVDDHKNNVAMLVCIYKGGEFTKKDKNNPEPNCKMPDNKKWVINKIDNSEKDEKYVKNNEDSNDLAFVRSQMWIDLVASFIRGFTMYGMIVLVSVGMWRFGRAMLDQAERLFEKRHALRQGRLFVHLNDGKLSIDEMEKAFNWNLSFKNAFGEMPADASAPWGNVINELVKIIPEIVKSNLESSKDKSKGDDGKKK